MRSLHTAGSVSARFDDPNLVSHAGLVPVMRLAEDAGVAALADDLLTLGTTAGSNAGAKVSTIVAGMAAGADSIDDLDVVRHGAMPRLFGGARAPSTLGTFLRDFALGHVAQLQNVSARVLQNLAVRAPLLLAGVGQLAFLDIDAKITRVFGAGKDGTAVGYTKVRGLNFLGACLSSPLAAPVITGTRLRGGQAHSARNAVSFVRANLAAARACGATATLVARLDSGFYHGEILAAILAEGARFSVTAPQNPSVRAAIAAIGENAWQHIAYGRPVHDADTGQWAHAAEIAEVPYTAFTNPTRNGQFITARLIVRRVRVTARDTRDATGELFPAYRYQAVFTNTGFDTVTAETQHRGRAGAIEAVFADLNNSALAHFPSGRFAANAAWLALAALTHNLLRAAGCLASRFHARAATGTIRRHLVALAARLTRTARTITLHLPQNWPRADSCLGLFTATHRKPRTA
ncbi:MULTISPECIES: IS1380 family transposase [unclassified Amycolatopsis]|uniref:IS1380 family transposase n=2 Tax=Amycolatopsis TaxID=1813 RepID=UPI000565467E|nr:MULTISPECIES: IS1380 family transposase [unclassified Amycolatopsis]